MKYTLKKVIDMYKKGDIPGCVFFWGHTNLGDEITKSCFSQWYESPFVVNGVQYQTAEQYMMAEKARLFNDFETLKKILSESNPKKCKELGRQIKNFSDDMWNKCKYDIVLKGNYEKFNQNESLRQFLLSTESKFIVEASPYDAVWGVKMSQQDANINNPKTWKGENLLGFALMEVRDLIK